MHYSEFFQTLKDSNYLSFCQQKQSENLIKKPGDSSVEEHHIYLRSFEDGKVDLSENLVYLSIADHIKAHLILVQDLENLGISGHTYYSALKSINITLNTRYELLTESERVDLERSIPEIASLRQKAKDRFQKEAQRIKKEKYGNVMGMCHTKEVRLRAYNTRKEKYGYGNGALSKPEHIQKALQTRKERYSGDSMGQCHTQEAVRKSLQTREKLYGNSTGACRTPEALRKAKETKLKKWGTDSRTIQMNVKEVRIKAETIRKANNEMLRVKILPLKEFQEWYEKNLFQGQKRMFNSKVNAARIFLRTFQEYQKLLLS